LYAEPESHPAPTCFVCGPMREDGMRIHVGPVDGRGVSAGAWVPGPGLAGPGLAGPGLAGPDGALAAELVWAVLDCPGGLGAVGDGELTGPPYLLGRLTVRQDGPVEIGEPHVVMGWRLAEEGRKLMAGSAIFTAAGQPVGAAR